MNTATRYHYLVLPQLVSTRSAAKGTFYAVRVDNLTQDRTTIAQGVSENDAYAAAQADATKLGERATMISKGE